MPLGETHALVEQFITAMRCLRPQAMTILPISVFSDEELRQMSIPTLLLVGDKEVVYQPQHVVERARQLMPHVEAEVVVNSGHLLPIDRADTVNARILTFLNP
jgi:pimeloyl-ACP methyl ester carboxylesterase